MSDINDIIGSIDRALWRVRDRTVNNITPFTYRDGLTYLEVLERIRGAVVGSIEYIGKFGEEQDKIIKELNEKVTTFIAEMEKTHDGWNKEIEAKRTEVLTTIKEFRAKLVAVAVTPTQYRVGDANVIGGALNHVMMNGDIHRALTVKAFEEFSGQVTNKFKATEDNVSTLLKTRYTKEESDSRYLLNDHRDHAIIIGSSNAVSGTQWCDIVCRKLGYTPHNYAIGGGAFTAAEAGRFDTQLNNAYSGLGDLNKRVGLVLIGDMLNDIRANNDVSDRAKDCANIISRNWPDAKVYIIPVILNKSSLNYQASYMNQNISRSIDRCRSAMLTVAPAICEGSMSWFWEGADVGKNHVRGNDEVHLPDASYIEAAYRTLAWVKGDTGWKNYGWTSIENYGVEGWGPKKSSMANVFVSRFERTVTVHGQMEASSTIAADSNVWSWPTWAGVVSDVYLNIFDHDRISRMFQIKYTDQLAARSELTKYYTYFFDNSYRIW